MVSCNQGDHDSVPAHIARELCPESSVRAEHFHCAADACNRATQQEDHHIIADMIDAAVFCKFRVLADELPLIADSRVTIQQIDQNGQCNTDKEANICLIRLHEPEQSDSLGHLRRCDHVRVRVGVHAHDLHGNKLRKLDRCIVQHQRRQHLVNVKKQPQDRRDYGIEHAS